MNHRQGLSYLSARLSGTALREFLVYEERLSDVLDKIRLFGETPELRFRRSEIIDQLNGLALTELQQSFIDCCESETNPRTRQEDQINFSSNAYIIRDKEDIIPKTRITPFSHLLQIMCPSERLARVVGPEIDSVLAVDDGLLFMRSNLRHGWKDGEIGLTFNSPAALTPELRRVADKNRAKLSYPNKTKYMIQSIVPPVLDKAYGKMSIKIHLAPISYFDIRGVELGLDDAIGMEGTVHHTLRSRYFKDHALFSEQNVLPNKAVIHILVITRDEQFLIMRRSHNVEFQNAQWSATFEEQMQGDYWDELTGHKEMGDEDLFATAVRGVHEELGIEIDKHAITFLGICSEYENLAYNIVGIARLEMSSKDIIDQWKLHAPDKAEHSRVIALPFERSFIFQFLQNDGVQLPSYGIINERWHPTSRIRIFLGAIHLFQ